MAFDRSANGGLCPHCLSETKDNLPFAHDPYDPIFDQYRCGNCGVYYLRYEILPNSTFYRFARWARKILGDRKREETEEN